MSKLVHYTELPDRMRNIIKAEIVISDDYRANYLTYAKPVIEWVKWLKNQNQYKHIADELISDPLFVALLLSSEAE